ncbi:hypothetical protein B5S33_g1744 [[Candida] boidinii]|nr:hypothetical protein B5S30_g241 [[Candida] boidinii]OWB83115.1 hypothetical protein B5S33_g1744 [[Candida] boidinii]GMG09292.1 unnamed protein product [[Candida] boidinii]
MKITDKLLQAHSETESPASFSFEFFTPKTSQGVQNLYDRMDRMYNLNPLFIDITWNAGGRLSTLTTEMVQTTQTVLGLETCMHLTCTNMSLDIIDQALENAFKSGCQNILALRGDPPLDGSESTGEFKYAKDLIKYIKKNYGDHFNIGIAAYPEGHPEEPDADRTLKYLKEKQDVGGDFIFTQMFYDVDLFIQWCKDCRENGITIPIIPGIMPISNYASFIRRATWSEINIPQKFHDVLDPIKDDDDKVRTEGTKLMIELCQTLLNSKYVNHLHFYTMNLEKSTLMILEGLNLIEKNQVNDAQPWRKSLNPNRLNESVRPIFWQNRKFTYITRTANWDEFPNGRWGDSKSPAFGTVDTCDGELIRHSPKKALELWGKPHTLKDLSNLVISYLNNKLSCLPWSDGTVTDEINSIKPKLIELNSKGFITVNSQPSINGLSSSDPTFGWGPNFGFIYQKQYLEFLCSSKYTEILIERIDKLNSENNFNFNTLSYYAVNSNGDLVTNTKPNDVNAVTWGVFPGKEIVQPTIVEKISFLAWKDEAFRLLKEWSTILNKNNLSSKEKTEENDQQAIDIENSKRLLDSVYEDFYLINIVDNNFVTHQNERIFGLFSDLNALA